jgi:pyruvate dehydrogenase kinase 2/3/4
MGQHLALRNPKNPDTVGIVCTHLNIASCIKTAVADASYICDQHYGLFGSGPKIDIVCDEKLECMYVASHLQHIVVELLKNSLRATVEYHGVAKATFPKVKVIVAEGNEASEYALKLTIADNCSAGYHDQNI